MTNKDADEHIDPILDKAKPNASKVPPRDVGYEPVERREPIEDEGQPYTGHKVLDDTDLGNTPAIARGKAPARPRDD